MHTLFNIPKEERSGGLPDGGERIGDNSQKTVHEEPAGLSRGRASAEPSRAHRKRAVDQLVKELRGMADYVHFRFPRCFP